MKIKAVSSLKGELVLASLNKSLRAGQEIAITEKSFWNEDVQIMYNARKIVISEGGEALPKAGEVVDHRYVVQSNHRKPLVFDSVPPFALRPGATLTISERQFDTDSIQQAISWGLILLLESPPPSARSSARDLDEEDEENDKDEVTEIIKSMQTSQPSPKRHVDDINVDIIDEHDQYKTTGKAQTLSRDIPAIPKDAYIYDPHNTRKHPAPNMKDAHIYNPNGEPFAKASNTLPVRGEIRPVGMTKSPQQEAQQRKLASSSNPKRVGEPRRVRPVGNGGDNFGGDGVDIDML